MPGLLVVTSRKVGTGKCTSQDHRLARIILRKLEKRFSQHNEPHSAIQSRPLNAFREPAHNNSKRHKRPKLTEGDENCHPPISMCTLADRSTGGKMRNRRKRRAPSTTIRWLARELHLTLAKGKRNVDLAAANAL